MDNMNHASEPVADETIEIEADSVEEAQKQAPEGYRFVIEKVLADGRAQSVQGSGDTVKAAFAQAQSSLPEGAQILAQKEVRPPGRRSCTLEARDEKRARSVAGRQLGETESIGRISLKAAGRKAFLGLIRLPDLYEWRWFSRRSWRSRSRPERESAHENESSRQRQS